MRNSVDISFQMQCDFMDNSVSSDFKAFVNFCNFIVYGIKETSRSSISICQQPDGIYIEWRAEEVLMLDGQNNADQEWAVIGSSLSVGYKPDRDSDACELL